MRITRPIALGIIGIGILLIASILTLYQLGKQPYQDYDESTYAEVTHEELTQGHIINLTYADHPYLNKPPLYFWLSGITSEVFGESPFDYRLPSALSAVALVVLVMLLAYELSGSATAALLSGSILATAAPVIETARQMRVDVLIAFFIALAAYGFVRGLRQEKWFLLFGAAAGCAIMTKSVIAVFAFLAVIIFALWLRRWQWYKQKYFWLGIGLCLLIALPWHIYETLHYGATFWQEYVGFNVGDRFSKNLFPSSGSPLAYIEYLFDFALPWTQLFIIGLLATIFFWRSMETRFRVGIAACGTLTILIAAVFFSAATKAPTYLLPLYPFAAVALGLWGAWCISRTPQKIRPLLYVVIGCLFLFGLATTIYDAFHFNPYYFPADELAREEKTVAAIIAQHPNASWYAYDDSEVGSIIYYSRNEHPLALFPNASVAPGSVILLYNTSLSSLQSAEPTLHTSALYVGQQITLLQTLPQ